jgi:heme oxygenase
LHDYPARCKATLLENDVRYLGGQVPDGAPIPPQIDRAWALGGFYVLEGASLGGAILLTLVRRNLGLSPQCGASYLASYGENLSRMWQHFGEQVNAQLFAEEDILRAIDSARHTFGALEAWLCGKPAG